MTVPSLITTCCELTNCSTGSFTDTSSETESGIDADRRDALPAIEPAHVRHERLDHECTVRREVASHGSEARHLVVLREQREDRVERDVDQRNCLSREKVAPELPDVYWTSLPPGFARIRSTISADASIPVDPNLVKQGGSATASTSC